MFFFRWFIDERRFLLLTKLERQAVWSRNWTPKIGKQFVGVEYLLSLLLLGGGGGGLHGDHGHHLGFDFVDLHLHLANHFISFVLVHDVGLGDGEGGDPGEDDEGGGVEPGPDVRQAPQAQPKLDSIDHVLNEEEATELGEGQVQLLGDGGGVGREVLRRDSQRHRGDLFQGVRSRGCLAQHNHHLCV